MKQAGKVPFLKKAIGAGANKSTSLAGRLGQKALRAAPGVATLGALSSFADSGPDEDDTMQRAMNQLKYGADMTDSELQDAIDSGKTFKDSGIIGENGLNEEEVKAYIAQNADKRSGAEKWGGRAIDALSFINPVATIGGAIYDNQLGKARNLNLQNIVGKLKADANEGTIRRNMEGTMGKFMAEGLLNKDFGRGNVRQEGGIKSPVDKKAQEEEAAAIKEYEAIKERDGVHAAIAHPSALKAGRVVYQDVAELSGGDKNTAEALLSGAGGQEGVGLTDQATMERYYGNPEKNALSNQARTAEAALAASKIPPTSAPQMVPPEGATAGHSLSAAVNAAASATTPEGLEAAKTMEGIATGLSPVAIEQRRTMANSAQSSTGFRPEYTTRDAYDTSLNNMAGEMYRKAYGTKEEREAPLSPQAQAHNDAWMRARASANAGRAQYQANRAAAANKEYEKFIVKPGDPDYKLGTKPSNGPSAAAMDEYMKATELGGGGAAPSVPAQVNASAAQPGVQPSKNVLNDRTPLPFGSPLPPNSIQNPNAPEAAKLPDIGGPARRAGEAIGDALFSQDGTGVPLPGGAKLRSPVMGASPYGIGNSIPQNMPQIPDIGGPARRAGGSIGNAIFSQNGTGAPLPGGANLRAPVMGASPYGIGNSKPQGIPQVPDIGAPGKAIGSAIGNVLFPQNQPGNPKPVVNNTPAYDAKGNLTDPKIAEMLAEQKRREIGARNAANKPKSTATRPDVMSRFAR